MEKTDGQKYHPELKEARPKQGRRAIFFPFGNAEQHEYAKIPDRDGHPPEQVNPVQNGPVVPAEHKHSEAEIDECG